MVTCTFVHLNRMKFPISRIWTQVTLAAVTLQLCPAWQICLTPFDQLYVLLFLPMKMRCDRVFCHYFTRGRDAVCYSTVIFTVRIFLFVPKHIYSCLWSLIMSLVRSFVECNVLYNVVCSNGVSKLMAQVYEAICTSKGGGIHVHQQS